MVLKKLIEFLDSQNARYTITGHPEAFTAQEIATMAHLPEKGIAKTVIVKVDSRVVMVVLPASDMVDFKLLKKALGVTHVSLATEAEFRDMFPGCEPGAMPPFGNLYNMDVLAADDLAEDQEIAFNAGTHRELVKMAYSEFERLVRPTVARISVRKRVREEENSSYTG